MNVSSRHCNDVCEDCPGWTFDRLRREGFSPARIRTDVIFGNDKTYMMPADMIFTKVSVSQRPCGNPLRSNGGRSCLPRQTAVNLWCSCFQDRWIGHCFRTRSPSYRQVSTQ